jgi:hypothetical protein
MIRFVISWFVDKLASVSQGVALGVHETTQRKTARLDRDRQQLTPTKSYTSPLGRSRKPRLGKVAPVKWPFRQAMLLNNLVFEMGTR